MTKSIFLRVVFWFSGKQTGFMEREREREGERVRDRERERERECGIFLSVCLHVEFSECKLPGISKPCLPADSESCS